jgi:protein-disulfide isomerase-like protein with CxxC motif
VGTIAVTHFTDPSCPWAYSASPAHAVLRFRYGAQLRWRTVMIGLSEDAEQYVRRGYTPARRAHGYMYYRRYGMPFLLEPPARMAASSRACRAVIAVRLLDPGREEQALRALQLAWFASPLVLDGDDAIAEALERVEGLDTASVIEAIDAQPTWEVYEADKGETRTAQGSPTEFQGKARQTDGPVRYSAPSVVFESGGRRLEAGGFQPVDAYDVLIANLDPTLERRAPVESALEALAPFPGGLVTQQVAAVMAANNLAPDREAAEGELIELAAEGRVAREQLGDGALWRAPPRRPLRPRRIACRLRCRSPSRCPTTRSSSSPTAPPARTPPRRSGRGSHVRRWPSQWSPPRTVRTARCAI